MMMELCKTKLEQEKQQRDVDEVLSRLASSCGVSDFEQGFFIFQFYRSLTAVI